MADVAAVVDSICFESKHVLAVDVLAVVLSATKA
jgi:hypothetical protein